MFEKEIGETIQRITRDVLQDKNIVALSEILESDGLSERLKGFFRSEVDWWIYTDSVARQRDRRFDYSHPELASLLNYMEQIQARHARFERDDFLAVIDSGVKLTYNYLCRPQTTLKWYVFRGEPTKPLGETLLRMNSFIDYPYFRAVFTDWIDRKREERPTFDSISAREYERIIRRIDDQILLSCTVDDLIGHMQPVFDFIGKGEEKAVPIDALIVYFDDKNIRRLVDFLESIRDSYPELSAPEFAHVMEELLHTSAEEPEADFSSVYQDDALDAVVREHLERTVVEEPTQEPPPPEDRITEFREHPPESIDVDESRHDEPATRFPEEVADHTPEAPDHEEHADSPSSQADANDDFFVDVEPSSVNVDDSDLGRPADGESDEGESPADPIIDLLIEPREEQILVDHESHAAGDSEGDEVRDDEEAPSDETQHEASDDQPENDRTAGIEEADLHDHEDRAAESEVPDDDDEEIDGEPDLESELDDVESDVFADTSDFEEKPGHGDYGTAREAVDQAYLQTDSGPSSRRAEDYEDVSNKIDPVLQKKVIKKIFGRDKEEYEKALEAINNTDSWRQASMVLDSLFIRFDVDPYSRTAIRFTDAVYGRYLSPVSGPSNDEDE